MKFLLVILISFVNIVCISKSTIYAIESIPVYTYYDFPPFSVSNEREQGLTYDLVELWNTRTQGKFKFVVEFYPRKRLDRIIAQGTAGLVIWVNPIWFKDNSRTKFLWTEPLLKDSNEVISLVDNKVIYNGPESFKGLIFGGLLGHVYVEFAEAIKQGIFERVDVISLEQTLKMVRDKHIDVSIIPGSAAKYLVRELNIENQIYYSPKAHQSFTRHILIQPQMKEVYQFLSKFVTNLDQDSQWKMLLTKYINQKK